MKLEQRHWTQDQKWGKTPATMADQAELVLIFGETSLLKNNSLFQEIKSSYPNAHLFGCTTSGEIFGDRVYDHSITTTAIRFAKTKIKTANLHLSEVQNSFEAGKQLASRLDPTHLTHVLVLSVGIGPNVNGSELVKGLSSVLPPQVAITGGLAGDQDRFQETLVISDAPPSSDMIAVVGFYGEHLKIGSASLGGWDTFGPERLVTKSIGNVVYEFDGKSALELYKKYLGEHSKDLPGSALLFPLSVRAKDCTDGLVRAVLSVDEEMQSLTFAGDVPEGSSSRFMKANFDRLIGGAIGAAEQSISVNKKSPQLALLISCVGRKIVLKQRVDEEVEGVREVFGAQTVLTGFYSYGEISPFTPTAQCELHNQTMTITTFLESDEN